MRKAWAKLGRGDSSTDCAAPGGDKNGSQATHAACTAQLPLLLPPSVPKDTVHLLCKGYSPKPGGQASKP